MMVAPSNFFSFIASSKVWMQTSSCDGCQPFWHGFRVEEHREKFNKVGRFPSYIDLHQELCSFLMLSWTEYETIQPVPRAFFVRIVNLHAVHRTKQWVFLAL